MGRPPYLGILIPPSGIFIIYGILTEQSVNQLFTAGIIPGLILSGIFVALVLFQAWRHPEKAPRGPRVTWHERVAVSVQGLDMVLLILLVIVGIVIGWFTPTEAGAVGAFGSIVLALLRKKLSWAAFKDAFLDTMRNTGLLFTVIIGAYIFTLS